VTVRDLPVPFTYTDYNSLICNPMNPASDPAGFAGSLFSEALNVYIPEMYT
jgi:hypothetical protein